MRTKEILEATSNRTEYNKAYKRYLAYTSKINCSFCPYHKRENCGRSDERNWKRYRRYQWRS